MDITSPGEMIARQRAFETLLTMHAESMMRSFLAGVRVTAHTGSVFPPDVHSRWRAQVDALLEQLSREVAEYVEPAFRESDIPDDVYSTVNSVLTTAAQQYATASERNAAIDRALSADSFEPEQVSASLVAAGYWDSLQDAGSVWIKRVRRITRTAATGLAGWTTITVMRMQDYELKRWVTRHDSKVRHSHQEADGQTVPVGETFLVGGWRLQYPGDRNAELGETVNCRCVLVGVR